MDEKQPTILLVDDVALFLELERSYLDGCGYRLEIAGSGEEALRRLEDLAPDLVLLDLYMPGMDGDEVCRQLRQQERWRQLPVIMVTSAGRPDETARCREAGCDALLNKPVNATALNETVRQLLERRQPAAAGAARIRFRQRDGEWRDEGRLGRLKADALYIHLAEPPAEGTQLQLALRPAPDSSELELRGKVVRSRRGDKGGMAVLLQQPGADYFQLLPPGEAPASREQQRLYHEVEQERQRLAAETARLQQRILDLEWENQDFAEQLVKAEEINNVLSNLYVAASRLHSTLNRDEVIEIIREVVINFVGAETFALLDYNEGEGVFRFEMGEGVSAEGFPVIAAGHGPIGQAVTDTGCYVCSDANRHEEPDWRDPLAVIPLRIRDALLGVLVIYRLLVQKQQFEDVDHQLFAMLGEQAATALFSATLYGRAERKQKTYREVMDLLLT